VLSPTKQVEVEGEGGDNREWKLSERVKRVESKFNNNILK
jgi:hypothetical protein